MDDKSKTTHMDTSSMNGDVARRPDNLPVWLSGVEEQGDASIEEIREAYRKMYKLIQSPKMREGLLDKTKSTILSLSLLISSSKEIKDARTCHNLLAKYCRLLYIIAPEDLPEEHLEDIGKMAFDNDLGQKFEGASCQRYFKKLQA